jgi:hypothetical protein
MPDGKDKAELESYKKRLVAAEGRISGLVEINTALIGRIEGMEKRMKTWEKAQAATYALQEEIRLRLESFSRGFVRYNPDVERDSWKVGSAATNSDFSPDAPTPDGDLLPAESPTP